MFRRFLFFIALLAIIWIARPATTGDHIVAAPEVKGATTTAFAFPQDSNLPNPNEILSLVNQARANEGLARLHANESLTEIATGRARDMAANHYYAHLDKSGKYYYDLLRQKKIATDYSCENLDMEFSRLPLPYVTDWLASSAGHRECLLNPQVTEAGYAVTTFDRVNYEGTPETAYIVVAIHATTPKEQ